MLVADPGSIASLVADMQTGRLDPEALVERYLARIEKVDRDVRAWRVVLAEQARRDAAQLKRLADPGKLPLFGLPVGIKDIIDVAGVPTRNGSPTCEDVPPAKIDAAVVADLRTAGAIILGKTHTTEFAHFGGPYPTCNPYDLARTPGGSSAGSGAAVAAGLVPAALGTQTAGSVNRPAAYCGVGAFKPSSRSLSGNGVTAFSPRFDTVGTFGHRAHDAAYLYQALAPAFAKPDAGEPVARLIAIDDPFYAIADTAVTAGFDKALSRLAAAGTAITRFRSPVRFADLVAAHRTISEFELGFGQRRLLDEQKGMVNDILIEAIERGIATSPDDYRNACRFLSLSAREFWNNVGSSDIIVAPAVPTAAPLGRGTGDPQFITPYTTLEGPIVTVPAHLSDLGLPESILLCARPGADLWLANRVGAIENAIRRL